MTRRVVITGWGCVSGLGRGVDETWKRAIAGDGAIMHFGLPRDETAATQRARGPAAPAMIPDLAAMAARFGPRAAAGLDPLVAFVVAAAGEALDQAALVDHPVLDTRTAVLVGCGSGGNATFETAYQRLFARGQDKVHPQTIPSAMISAPASQLAMLFGIHGPAMVLASACASSAHALGEAMHMIRSGRADAALAGGGEACLTLGSWVSWASLGAMADDTCRPFSAGRRGLALGEGAAMLVLEERDHAIGRGATILGELRGYGATSAAAHVTVPHAPGIAAAIRAAHADADLAPDVPLLVSSHGTGTRLNDAAETMALRDVYGTALCRHRVIATKSAHGHLIGGSGALELILGFEALRRGTAPPVLNHLGRDPDCDLPLVLEPTAIDADHIVSNSFAFGGLNAVLIGQRP